MLGIILAGGDGTRFSENGCCKPLLTVNGKYLIEYALNRFVEMNIHRVLIVAGTYLSDICTVLGDTYRGVELKYILQDRPRGIFHALVCACPYIDDPVVALQLSDELFLGFRFGEVHLPEHADFMCGYTVPDDPMTICENYSLICEGTRILATEEKPPLPVNEKKGTGFCIFSHECLLYILKEYNMLSHQNDLCDIINLLILNGKAGLAVQIADEEININDRKQLEYAQRVFESMTGVL